MALPYKINTNDLIEFVKVYNHEYSGKEWSVDSFRTALENWVNPTKIVCDSQKVEQGKSNCNLHSVVFSETANICNTCYKPIKMVDNTLQLLCECESVAEVCEHKETYKKVRFGVELTKCKKCRKILS